MKNTEKVLYYCERKWQTRDAKSVDFSWKGKTGALHKPRAYDIIRTMLRFTENNEVIRDDAYRAILVGLQTSEDISYSMEELKGLAEAANVEVLGQMIQNLERPNTATLLIANLSRVFVCK